MTPSNFEGRADLEGVNEAKGYLLDLDGTTYRGSEVVPGAELFINRLRILGKKYLFITNNSTQTPEQISKKLQAFSIPCTKEQVLTVGEVVATSLKPGKLFCIGEEGLKKTLSDVGMEFSENNVNYVVVGLDRNLTYEKLSIATRLIREGALFVATNRDKVLVTEKGLSPGAGAIVESVIASTGIEPVSFGKPKKEIVLEALKRLSLEPDEAIVIGDNVETDILAGKNAGVKTLLLLGGVSNREDAAIPEFAPTWIAKEYTEILKNFS